MSPAVVTASRPVIDLNPSLRVPHDIVLPVEPVKKPLTAETAETAEKKTLRILGVLCVLSGKTPYLSHALQACERGAKAPRHACEMGVARTRRSTSCFESWE